MSKSYDKRANAIIVTLLFPFIGLVVSLRHWREKWAKNTFWLACVYFGAIFIYCPSGTLLGDGGDGGRYVLKLIDMYNNASTSLAGIFSAFRDQGNQVTMDLYQPLMTFLISRFTDSGHMLFAAFAIVFGFFYSRNIWFILERLPKKNFGVLFILVALFFLVCPITSINGVRMWTALHVFVYGMMPFVLEHNKSKLWWSFISPLFHFSYLYVVLIAVLFIVIPRRFTSRFSLLLYVLYFLFIISLFINSINYDSVSQILVEYSPESYEARIGGFVSQDYADARSEASALNNWYVGASGLIIHWTYCLVLVFLLPYMKHYFANNPSFIRLYYFTLLLSGFANVSSLIPSGGRFQLLSQMFVLPLILLVAMNMSKRTGFRKMVSCFSIVLILPLIFQLRQLLDYFSITLFFGNFFTLLFWENNVPLISYLKRIV